MEKLKHQTNFIVKSPSDYFLKEQTDSHMAIETSVKGKTVYMLQHQRSTISLKGLPSKNIQTNAHKKKYCKNPAITPQATLFSV